MLMNMKELLAVAYEHHFAVGSFNVANSEFVRVVVDSAEEKMPLPSSKSIRMKLSCLAMNLWPTSGKDAKTQKCRWPFILITARLSKM